MRWDSFFNLLISTTPKSKSGSWLWGSVVWLVVCEPLSSLHTAFEVGVLSLEENIPTCEIFLHLHVEGGQTLWCGHVRVCVRACVCVRARVCVHMCVRVF